ncbi:hypothetical protein [Salibacterium qingdaonense]|uniref:Lipoprotein n=1 Tax=Salibacterium qingdaonense TaxID=266892 RepID=A0A1I4NSF9_9BACI|nr:hypothetical protein [Salibacterium qingdaonense]SFM18462.1 hypothetical protein SAMN04488054_12025 [Salibacterium qingdaonense]
MIKIGTLIFFILLAGCSSTEQHVSFSEIMTNQDIDITKITISTVTENGVTKPANQIEVSTEEKMQHIISTLNDADFYKTNDPETMQNLQNHSHTPGNIFIYFEKEGQSTSANNEFFGLTAYKEKEKATLYTEDGSETYYYSNIDFSELKKTVNALEN